jgi:hypothetical protein
MDPDDPLLASVAAALWEERQRLEELLFTLVAEQLVVASGQTRWLARADAQVRGAVAGVQDGEVARAMQVQSLAHALGIGPDSSLADLAQASPEPWNEVFTEHRTALRGLMGEIEGVAAENRRLLLAGSQAIRDMLDRLGPFAGTYDARGGSVRRPTGSALLDEQA